MLPFEFCGEVKREETRVMGLSSSEDPIIVAGVVLTQCERVTDKRTERRTDLVQLIQRSAKRSVKITGLCDTFRCSNLAGCRNYPNDRACHQHIKTAKRLHPLNCMY